jgi:WD40 repeat protein
LPYASRKEYPFRTNEGRDRNVSPNRLGNDGLMVEFNAELDFKAKVDWLMAGGRDGVIRLWNPDAGKSVKLKGHEKAIRALALSGTGNTLAAMGGGRLTIWDLSTRKQGAAIVVPEAVGNHGLVLAPDAKTVAWGTSDGHIQIAALPIGKILRTIRAGILEKGLQSLAFSRDGRKLLAGGHVTLRDEKEGNNWSAFHVFDTQHGKELLRIDGTPQDAKILRKAALCPIPVAFAPSGKIWAGGGADNVLYLGEDKCATKHSAITALAFTSDSKTLISAGQE